MHGIGVSGRSREDLKSMYTMHSQLVVLEITLRRSQVSMEISTASRNL